MYVEVGARSCVDDVTFGGFKRIGEIRTAIFEQYECASSPFGSRTKSHLSG
uniref:Uncharacterized protein n=1 Tax=Candidatus Methanogaster sp. ANME-2c ERB4 TaxID=2759911 RepID=A0A7G9YRT2_9EURY|nr:hypothetical protein HLBKPKBF_00034 [Methanosarcinales archaeon ANME-2c ERB4]